MCLILFKIVFLTNILQKICKSSGIRTQIVRIEGEQADHTSLATENYNRKSYLFLPMNHCSNFGLGQLEHGIRRLGQTSNGSDGAAVFPDLGQVAKVHDVRTAGKVEAYVDGLKRQFKLRIVFGYLVFSCVS